MPASREKDLVATQHRHTLLATQATLDSIPIDIRNHEQIQAPHDTSINVRAKLTCMEGSMIGLQ